MRFEAKNSLFKRVVIHTHGFQNILLSLSMKHQFMVVLTNMIPRVVRPLLQPTRLCTMDVSILGEDIQEALQIKSLMKRA